MALLNASIEGTAASAPIQTPTEPSAREPPDSGLLTEHRNLLPSGLKEALRHHQMPKARSKDTFVNAHLPQIREHLSLRMSGGLAQPTVVILGDEVLSNLVPELERPPPPVPIKRSRGSQDDLNPGESTIIPTYLDFTVPGDRISNVLHRLETGLFDSLAALFRQSSNASNNVIVLSVGTHDLPKVISQNLPAVFSKSDLSAFNVLLDVLLHLDDMLQIVVLGLFPRKDVDRDVLQRATAQLLATMNQKGQQARSRIELIDAPVALRAGHLQNRVILNPDGCEILDLTLRPAIDRTISASSNVSTDVPRSISRASQHQETREGSSHTPLRPAQDVLSRILHDNENFDADQVVVGYLDRHDGMQELKASAWQKDSTDDEFIPLHRIRYFKRSGRLGQVLWDREKRIDGIFRVRA